MPITLNGTTGVVTPGATVGSITGVLKATSGVVSQAVAGTDYLTSTSGGSITLATAQTASGTAIDFTGIPSWAKRITVMFSGVSTSGSSHWQVQVGNGSIISTGYISSSTLLDTIVSSTAFTAGFGIRGNSPSIVVSGAIFITLVGSNEWIASGVFNGSTSATSTITTGGSVVLLGTLDRLRVTTVNGTDTFDGGKINISYE